MQKTLLLLLAAGTLTASAANFTLTSNSSTAQSLTNGESGLINPGVFLSTSGGTVALTMTGTSQFTNNGTIRQTGTGRTIDSNSGNATLTVINNGAISAAGQDAFRVNTAGTNVTMTNNGNITATGGQGIAWSAILTGSNSLTNYGNITATGGDAVRPGTNGVVTNFGVITGVPTFTTNQTTGVTTASGSDGIDLRVGKTGVLITNNGTITGRHGIATDGANVGPSSVTIINNPGGLLQGVNGSGINVDGVQTTVTANVTNAHGATIRGGVLVEPTAGDGDGIDIDGILTLDNSGDILAYGAKGSGSDLLPNNPEAIAIGGGTILNRATGRIIGSSLTADAPNGDASRFGSGILVDDSSNGNAIAATTVANEGLIWGKTGFAIKIISTFANTITNNSTGTIRAGGNLTAGAAIQSGNGDDVVNNAGTIIGENGLAIDLQGGNDTLTVTGGSIQGDIDGGAGTNSVYFRFSSNATFSYGNAIRNFQNTNIESGTVAHSGSIDAASTIRITGGVYNYTGIGALASTVAVEGGEFKSNGGNFTGTLNLVSGKISGTNLAGVALTIGSNVVLSPGNSPGTLVTAGQTWAGGGSYLWEINRLATDGGAEGAAIGWDFTNINGDLTINATSGNKFTLILDSVSLLDSWNNLQDYSFVIARITGSITGFDPTAFTIDWTAFADQHDLGGGTWSVGLDGQEIRANFTAVPEPSTIGLAVTAILSLGLFRARRRRAN